MGTLMRFRNLTIIIAITAAITLTHSVTARAQTGPVLEVHPDTLSFYADFCGGDPVPGDTFPKSFMVANIGGGAMIWTGIAEESWVHFDPVSGGNFDSVMVWIDWAMAPVIFTPPQPGDTMLFETRVTIDAPGAENSPQDVIIQLGYTCDPDEYRLAVYPTYIELDLPPDDNAERWFHVWEAHNAHIEFYFTNTSDWLFLPQTFAPLYTPDSVQFWVSTADLEPGIYYDTITIQSSNASNIVGVAVRLNVTEDGTRIATTPHYYNIVMPPEASLDTILSVYEVHGENTGFIATSLAPWLNISGGPTFITPEDVELGINTAGMAPGYYVDTVFIYPDTDLAAFQPVAVPVFLIVRADVAIVRTIPEALHFNLVQGESIPAFGLFVYEESGDSMHFAYESVAGSQWLTFPNYLALKTTPDSLFVGIHTEGLSPGVYGDSIVIYYPLDDIYGFTDVIVPVVLVVHGEQPTYSLRAEPLSFDFIVDENGLAFDTLHVFDSFGQHISFTHYNSDPWLAVNPFEMPPLMTPMSMPVAVNAAGLLPGNYADTIFINAEMPDTGYAQTIYVPVSLTVRGIHLCGDANGDEYVNIGDAIYILNYVFRDGPPPFAFEMGDANCDQYINVGDVVSIVVHIFRGGPPPGCAWK